MDLKILGHLTATFATEFHLAQCYIDVSRYTAQGKKFPVTSSVFPFPRPFFKECNHSIFDTHSN